MNETTIKLDYGDSLIDIIVYGVPGQDYVFGDRKILPRFFIEDDFKPAIFGSYAYDPVKGAFEPPEVRDNKTTVDDITTATTDQETKGSEPASVLRKNTRMMLRNNAVGSALNDKFQWWTQAKTPSNMHNSVKQL